MTHFSNCLIAALVIRYRLRGSSLHMIKSTRSPFPHFYVTCKAKRLDFHCKYTDEPLYGQLWYEGSLRVKRHLSSKKK